MWAKEEKLYLKQNYHKLDVSISSTRLNKTPAAVRQAAFRLNLTNKNECHGDMHPLTKYSDEDVRLMKLLKQGGMRVKEIAEKFEISQFTASHLITSRRLRTDL